MTVAFTSARGAPVKPVNVTSKPQGIILLNGAAIAEPLPDLEYLIPQLGLVAGSGAPHLVAGYGYTGKTITVQSLLLSLAAYRSLWGAYRSSLRRVIHVDLEQGDRLTRRRYQRLALDMGVDLCELGDALVLTVMPGLRLFRDQVDEWCSLMEGRDLLVIDSLRAATPGADENDSTIREGLDMLAEASESTGCRSLVIHHSRKTVGDETSGKHSIRGSSAIFDACDSVYVLTGEKGEPIRVEHVKARTHGELIEDLALVITDVQVGADPRAAVHVQAHAVGLISQQRDERQQIKRKQVASQNAETVRRVLIASPGLGTRELREATALSGTLLAESIAELGAGLEIREEKDGRSKTRRHYLKGVR